MNLEMYRLPNKNKIDFNVRNEIQENLNKSNET